MYVHVWLCASMCVGTEAKGGLLVLSSPGTQEGYTIIFCLIPLGQDLPLVLEPGRSEQDCPSLTPHPVLGLEM